LGLSSFFARRIAEPITPAVAAQPSLDTTRGEPIWEFRFVFMRLRS
jgi:hypothetical protein